MWLGLTRGIGGQAEVLLKDFWDPGSGAIFAEQGDQERFWKLTRKFSDNLAGMVETGKVRTVSWQANPTRLWISLLHIDNQQAASFLKTSAKWRVL